MEIIATRRTSCYQICLAIIYEQKTVLLLAVQLLHFHDRITKFFNTAFLVTVKQTAAVNYQNKVTLISILIFKAIGCTQKSKMFSCQSSLQAFKVYFRKDLFPSNDEILLPFLSFPNISNLFDTSSLAKAIFLYHQIHNNVFESSK